jgi:hypothetical protein
MGKSIGSDKASVLFFFTSTRAKLQWKQRSLLINVASIPANVT